MATAITTMTSQAWPNEIRYQPGKASTSSTAAPKRYTGTRPTRSEMCPANGTETIPISDPTATAIGPIDHHRARRVRDGQGVEEVRATVLCHPQPDAAQHAGQRVPEDLTHRVLGNLLVLLQDDKRRTLPQPHPDEQGDQDQQDRRQERDPPHPAEQNVLRDGAEIHEHHRGQQGP